MKKEQKDIHADKAWEFEALSDYVNCLKELKKAHRAGYSDKLYYYNAVRINIAVSHYREAEKLLESAINILKNDGEIMMLYSRLCRLENRPEEALLYIKKALKKEPDNKNFILEAALAYENASKFVYAIRYFKRLLSAQPSLDIYVKLAKLYELKKEYGESLKALSSAEKLSKDDINIKISISRMYRKLHKFSKAATVLERSYTESKKNPDFLIEQARFYIDTEDLPRALETYDKLLSIDKSISKYYIKASDIALKMHDYDKALAVIEKAIFANIEDPQIYYRYGMLKRYKSEYSESLKYLEKVKKNRSLKAKVSFELGLLYRDMGDSSKALKILENLNAELQDNSDFLKEISLLYMSCEKFLQAEKNLKYSLKLNPEDKRSALLLARTYIASKKYKKAQELLKVFYEKYSDDLFIIKEYAFSLLKTRSFSKTIDIIESANGKYLKNPQLIFELAQAYEQQGLYKKSIKILERSLLQGIESSEIRRSLSRLYRITGNPSASKQNLKQALQLNKAADKNVSNEYLNIEEFDAAKTVLSSKPRMLSVHLTNRCNIKCIMCKRGPSDNRDISKRLFLELMSLLPYLEHVSWLGGEVFLSKYFEKLFDRGAEIKDLKQEIVTNGLLIDKYWAEKLSSSNTDIYFSIDAFEKDLYEKIRRGADYNKLVSNISLLNSYKSAGTYRGLYFVIMKNNYMQLKKALKFLKKYYFNEIKILPVLGDDVQQLSIYRDKKILNETFKIIEDLKEQASSEGIKVKSSLRKTKNTSQSAAAVPQKICKYPWQSLIINMNGTVYPWCYCQKKVGNVNKNTILELWNGKIMQKYRKEILQNNISNFCWQNCPMPPAIGEIIE